MSKYGSYGVACSYESIPITVNTMHCFPLVISCSSREEAIALYHDKKRYMKGDIIPFKNPNMRTEVNWEFIIEHKIVV